MNSLHTSPRASQPVHSFAYQSAQPVCMVIEDHSDTRELIKILLELRGWHIVEAASGEEALQRCEAAKIDLVILNYALPHTDGLKLLQQLRAQPHLAAVPAVMVSGYADAESRLTALAGGCNRYIVKPFRAAELYDAVSASTVEMRRHRAATNSIA